MKIVHWMPLDEAEHRVQGGHVTQIVNTVNSLCRYGIDASISYDRNATFFSGTIIHAYGVDEGQIAHLRRQHVSIVLSPIYWPEYVLDTHASRFRRLLAKLRKQTALISRIAATSLERDNRFLVYAGRYAKLARVFSMVDMLVPNSMSEGLAIRDDLNVTTKAIVVPLGVDQQTFYDEGAERSKRSVLYVGRIEPHKNQLGLIKALRKTDIRLVLVGRLHPDHNEYCQRVLSNCVGNIKYAGYGDSTFLRSQYNSAAVHVLPSWSETVGLTSLEASSCGAKIVHTKNGFGVEYFGESVLYCDPSSSNSILSTITKTIESDDLLQKQHQCVSKYTWENSISELVKAYSQFY